jgi:mRNA interferase YafQ
LARKTRPKAPKPPEPPPPLILETTPQSDRDLKRQEKRGKSMEKLRTVDALRTHQPFPRSHRDHALKGDWDGFRECHVGGESDWLLVYVRHAGRLTLFRTGRHEEVFSSDRTGTGRPNGDASRFRRPPRT